MATPDMMPSGYDGPLTLQHRVLVAFCLVLSALLLVASLFMFRRGSAELVDAL